MMGTIRLKRIKHKTFDEWPLEIQFLYMCAISRIPVGSKTIEMARQFPEFWNLAGEFDPFHHSRNLIYNIGKILKRKIGWWWYLSVGKHLMMRRARKRFKKGEVKGIWNQIQQYNEQRQTESMDGGSSEAQEGSGSPRVDKEAGESTPDQSGQDQAGEKGQS